MAHLPGSASIDVMQVGDEIELKVYPYVASEKVSVGKIVYIHPKKCFFQVEFTVETTGRKIRESFSANGPRAIKDSKEDVNTKQKL